MIRVNYGGDVYPLQLRPDEWHVTHAYNGMDVLEFDIDTGHEYYCYMIEETPIEVDGFERYLIKSIDERTDFATVKCEIDLDDWQGYVLTDARWTNSTIGAILEQIKPQGWTVSGAGRFTRRTTVGESEGQPWPVVTPIEILDTLSEVYEVVFNFSPRRKIIEVIDPEDYPISGDYLSDEVNLTSIGFVGDSTNFATRLYAYGKQDEETGERVTFASINGGREYVENHSYSDKIICVGWSDERYTVPENLLADAQKRLDAMAFPVRSYNLTVENLDDELFLYKKVNLIDRRRKISVVHQVIEFTEYPDDHTRDNVNLSAVTPQIQTLFDKQITDFHSELDYRDMSMQKVIEDSIQHATDMITGNKGGYFQWIFDDDGRPIELVNLHDSMDINSATDVWRWNASGLGHSSSGYAGPYTLALLDDGSINADVITTGTLNAGVVRAGILSDVTGNITWDLESGEMHAYRLSIDSTNFKLDENGNLKAWDATLRGTVCAYDSQGYSGTPSAVIMTHGAAYFAREVYDFDNGDWGTPASALFTAGIRRYGESSYTYGLGVAADVVMIGGAPTNFSQYAHQGWMIYEGLGRPDPYEDGYMVPVYQYNGGYNLVGYHRVINGFVTATSTGY